MFNAHLMPFIATKRPNTNITIANGFLLLHVPLFTMFGIGILYSLHLLEFRRDFSSWISEMGTFVSAIRFKRQINNQRRTGKAINETK